jgi:hypothetical protein
MTEFPGFVLIEPTDGGFTVQAPDLSPQTASLMAHMVAAGRAEGEVEGVALDDAAAAVSELDRVFPSVRKRNEPGVDLAGPQLVAKWWFKLALGERGHLVPGCAEACALAARAYDKQLLTVEEDLALLENAAPSKRGRPTMASGRGGTWAHGGVRVSGTRLDKAARRTRDRAAEDGE